MRITRQRRPPGPEGSGTRQSSPDSFSRKPTIPQLHLTAIISVYISLLTFLTLATSAALAQQQNFLVPGHNLENIRISETEPIDSIVHTLKAIDRFNENRRFSYHMTGDIFSVNEETGEIRLVKQLDRERQSQVVVVVSVFDVNDAKGDLPVESKRRTIVIEDVDDSRPTFAPHKIASSNSFSPQHVSGGHIVYQVDIGELAPVGSIVLAEIQVSDADEGVNAEVVFECRPKHSTNMACDVFAIESRRLATGRYSVTVRTKAPLDYERVQGYRLSVNARGKRPSPLKGVPLESEAIVNINVINVQDEGPVFVNAPYSLSMVEGLRNGSRLLNLIVQDGDAAPQRELSMIVVPGPFSDYFQVSKDPELSKVWYLETNTTIDRESPLINDLGNMFSISLLAAELDEETGLPVASELELLAAMREINYSKGTLRKETVTVLVQDLPDSRPIFVQASTGRPIKDNLLIVNVSESLTTGSAVPNLNLAVHDLDQGVNSRFNLSLMDIDMAPSETAQGVAAVASSAFALETEIVYGKAEVVLNVLNSSLLDYENPSFRSYKFNLVASKQPSDEPPLIQILEIQFDIQDSNDNAPEFDRDQYLAEVIESAAPGTHVATIRAQDRDSGAFGRIDYSLRGAGASKFKLVAGEGRIIVADCGVSQCLDYESQPSFSLTYEAHDGAGRSKNVSLIINVLDVNDHRPRFTESIYKRELISDNLSSKQNYISPQLIVRATDEDGPSQGRNNLTYRILRSNLTGLDVDPQSGLVYLSELVDLDSLIEMNLNGSPKRRLDDYNRKLLFEAEVSASDNGSPPQNATARIQLTVKGNRDGAPQFKQDFYQAFVRENHPINKPFYQVQAVDPDDKDSQLRYSLGFDLNDLLSINAHTGELAFKSRVDYDDFRGIAYNVTVYATDNSKPQPLRATAAVGIVVQDVNDKPPRFLESEYKATLVQGRSKPGDVVLELEARDPDKNAQLVYSTLADQLTVADRNGQQFSLDDLVNSTSGYLAHLNKSDRVQLANNLKRLFQINKKSALVELKEEPDYSFVSSLSLPVRVQDLNQEIFERPNELQLDFATCTFYFQTHVDKSPIFAPPWSLDKREYNLTMLEELQPGSSIFSLLATDPSTNGRVETFEKVLESDPRDLFHVSRTGVVSIGKRVDFEELPVASKKLALSVKALTSEGFFSFATLNIQVIDLNDNAPQFSSNQNYSVTISESAVYPQEVITVHAEDRDSAQFGQVHYFLSSGYSSDLFAIDQRKGVLIVRKGTKLDRDSEAQHTIQVVASDCNETARSIEYQEAGYANCKRSSILVNIALLDENDNEPIFSNVNKRGEFEAITSETVSVGSVVAQAQASDLDDGLNGQVSFEIVRGAEGTDQASRLFRISREGAISVAESLSGMGRNQPYKITIRAFDQGKTITRQSYAHLLLTISDVVANDGVPKFIRPRADEVVQLSENAGPNTFVYQVQALDPDEEANGKLMYKFLVPSEVFDIDPFEGVIRTQNRLNFRLDREQVANYTLIIVAQDLGSPPKQTQQILVVRITDVNDNEPYFERAFDDPPVVLLVEEEAAAKDFLVGTIRAVDKDTGANALIGYEILEGNVNNMFRLSFDLEQQQEIPQLEGINPCRIYSTGRLDRETRESYTLTIRASSMSKIRNPFINQIKEPLGGNAGGRYNASDLTKIRVLIKLLDVNDNRPVFVQQNAKSIVDSSAEIYSQLMVFKALDADSSNPEVQYSILDVLYYSDSKYRLLDDMHNGLNYQYHTTASAGLGYGKPISMKYAFDIDSRSGIMRNTISLRAYIDGYFEVFVKADSGYNQLAAIGAGSGLKSDEDLMLLNYATTTSSERRLAPEAVGGSCNDKQESANTTGPYAELESCNVAVTRAVVFVTHQRETFRFVFNKTKLNDRLDEFKSKVQLALEEMMFEPSQQQSNLQVQASYGGSSSGQQSLVESKSQPKADKIFLNTFNTEFYERDDGSLDFSTLTSCSQLVKFEDRNQPEESRGASSNQVITYEEVLSLLKNLNSTQSRANQPRGSLFVQYGLVNIERCPPDKTLYRMSLAEKVALYFAVMIALVGSLLALVVSNRRKNYERKLRLLQRSKYQIELMCGSVQNIRPLFF